MGTVSSSLRDLAQRLVALEAASQCKSDPDAPEGVLVCDKLRISLTRFAGAEGFTALLRRALALARADAPLLENVRVSADGRLEGLEEFATAAKDESMEALTAIIAHLLESD